MKEKRFVKRVSLGYYTDEKNNRQQRRVTLTAHATCRRNAERIFAEQEMELRKAIINQNEGPTTLDELIKRYYEDHNLKTGTISRDKYYDTQILNWFGKKKLNTITTDDVLSFFKEIQEEKNWSDGTTFNCRKTMKRYFKYAYRRRWIKIDPFYEMERIGKGLTPNYKSKKGEEATENTNKVIKYIINAPTSRSISLKTKLQVMLSLDGCLRPTELYALNIGDVNIEKKYIYVNKDLTVLTSKMAKDLGKERMEISETKTKGSERKLPISELTVQYLQQYLQESKEYLKKRKVKNPNNYLFYQKTNLKEGDIVKPESMSGLKSVLRKVAVELGLKKNVTPYDLRKFGRTVRSNLPDYNRAAALYVIGHVENVVDDGYISSNYPLAEMMHPIWEKKLMELLKIAD